MLRDVFYYGQKPNVHPRERFAKDLNDARHQATTEHFWIINEHCSYKNFDWDWSFDFLPDEDVWAEDHNNVWPSPYQKDSGTWLCSTNVDAVTIYRNDVDPVPLKDEVVNNWKIIEYIEKDKFDFKWHPDPSNPPYIYVFGNEWYPGTVMPTVEYHVPGATDKKYITDTIAHLLPMPMLFNTIHDCENFDYSWRPDPTSPPYIYVFGNTQYPASVMPTIEYHVEGATEKKYIDYIVPKLAARPQDFEFLEDVEPSSFDCSWVPDPKSPPYIYAWGNQWNKPEDKISVQYVVEGATEYKYMEERAKRKPCMDNWIIPEHMVKETFDFSWEPNPNDPPYIYQFGTQWQKTGGPKYIIPNATEIKYIDDVKAQVFCRQFTNWLIPRNIDQSSFDFSWHPDPRDPPYIYQFGDQWQKTGGPRFVVDGATEIKLIDKPIAKAKPDKTHWIVPEGLDTDNFDFSWHPDVNDPPRVYQFATQWSKTGGPKFIGHHATEDSEIVYIDTVCPRLSDSGNSRWQVLIPIKDFDFSWHPDSTEESYIYVFGNQWYDAVTEPTITYTVPGATEKKYITDIIAYVAPTTENWETLVPVENFDYSWRPHPDSPPYIYVWGNQWNDCYKEPTVTYTVPGATEYKYMDEVATVKPTENEDYWEILIPISRFDFSWRPDPTEPPFIYVFGNKYNDAETEPTVIYRLPGATEYKFIDTLLATPKINMTNWAVRNELDLKVFDFSWRPNPKDKPTRYEWGTDGPIYTVPDFVDIIKLDYDISIRDNLINNKVEELKIKKITIRSMFFVDKGNQESQQRYNLLKKEFPQLLKTRYLNSWVETISRCTAKSETELFWVLSSELDYTEFDFDYNPNPWQKKMIHVFGSQWTHWGNTYLINKNSFNEDTKYVKIIEHLSMLNFVKDKRTKATSCLYDVVLIDHGNDCLDVVNTIKNKILDKNLTVIEYDHSYLKTFKDILNKLESKKEHYIWICSSICDYTNFDFSYICDPFAKEQLHVFPSDKQKFGDTFLVDVNKFRSLINDMIMLEDYEKVNYNQHQRVKRLPAPTITTKEDTHVNTIHTDFNWPYVTFITEDNKELEVNDIEPMSLWTSESKNIIITSTGASRIIVPKEAKEYVEEELYDYPYISRSNKLAQSKPLDIIFLSNGEINADENYEHLLKVTKGLYNRVVRVDGVNGRVNAYHAAAKASETPWMFTVFAKLKVNEKFDWGWQPDRMQIPKHYIFYATNPVNGLEYGHQAMIAYNKKITLANTGVGLDFTLDNAHEVVELNSGIANYNVDEFTTWRTAFREALKLCNDISDISAQRLDTWLTVGNGMFGEFSTNGAKDAVEYFKQVNGNLDKLRLSYDWAWLKEFYIKKYKI